MDSLLQSILELLSESKKSQKELADYLQVPKGIITDWKTGRSKSYTKYLPQISKYFDVDVDYLLGNQDIKKQAHQKNGEPVNEYAEKLSAMLNQMSLENLQKVLEYVEFLQKKNSNQ